MRLAAVFPTNEIGNDMVAIRDWVETAEGLGYHSIVTYDHVLGAVHEDRTPPLWGPYNEHDPFHEPMVLFGWMAALTTRIQLVTGVIIAPQRQTALLAKQAVQLDVMSGGRFVLGLGTGWNHVEYESLDESFEGRGARLDEQFEVLRRLFREPIVDYTGEQHRIDRAGLLPRPIRDIPIWCGGSTAPALRRAARLADGFIYGGGGPRIRAMHEQLKAMIAVNDRNPAAFEGCAMVNAADGAASWVAERDAWQAVGGTELGLQTMDTMYRWRGAGTPNSFTTAAQHIEALRVFASAMNG